jgi:hypothetical protein
MKNNIESDFPPFGNPKSESASAQLGIKDQLKPIIAQEINNGLYKNAIEEKAWDFTVEREYQSNKKKKRHRPFAAARKSDALREQDCVKKVRERFAEDVNSIAVAAGLGKIYDPRDYATMGVNAPSTKKLGPKQHALEVKGIPTKDGIDNEAAQTVFEMSMIEQAHQDRSRHLDQVQFHWQNVSSKSPPHLDAGKLAVDAELHIARMANDIRRDLDHLALEQERERSRANLVSQRQWKISTSASASAAAKLRSAELAKTADAYIAELDERDTAVTANLAKLESFALEYGANQVAMAIVEFELNTRALGIEREIQPSAKIGCQAKRINMVKAGILERPKADRQSDPQLAETALPAIAEKNVAHQVGSPALPQNTSALHASGSIVTEAEISRTTERDIKTDVEPTVVAQSMIVTTYPTMPINSWPDPQHNELQADDRANVFPGRISYRIDESDQTRLQAVDDIMAILPAQMQPSVEPLLDTLQDLPSPISEPSASLIDAKLHPLSSAPGVGLSMVDYSSGGNPAADSVHELVRVQQNAKKDNSAGNRLSELEEKSQERTAPPDEQNHLPTLTPNGAAVISDATRKSVDPMIDELRMPQAPRDTLIPTETIKATFPPAPKPAAAVLPSHLIKEWDQLGLNELETFDKIEMAGYSLVSINGVVSFARPEAVTEIERLCLSAFPKSAKALFVRHEADRAAKTDLLNTPPASTATSPFKLSDFRSKDVPTISTRKDSEQKDSGKLSATMVATAQSTVDGHDSLIHRFENAQNDKERYEVAALIRADKIALERLVLRNDPNWGTVDRQYKNRQQIAGALRRDEGLGG